MSNKNPGWQTDGQTETGDLFLRTVGVMKGHEKVKVESRSMDSITILLLVTRRKYKEQLWLPRSPYMTPLGYFL